MRKLTLLLINTICLIISGCHTGSISTAASNSQESISNPATRRCIQEGYLSKPSFSSQGTPKGNVCLNPKTGKKCQEWSYFLGKCQLSDTQTLSASQASQGGAAKNKCIQDHYISEVIVSNNLVIRGECVNPRLGKRCEEWAYFRGECQLDIP